MRYFLNKNAQENGDHEVHIASCDYLPFKHHRIDLGDYDDGHAAVATAKEHYHIRSNGCAYCLPEEHTG